MKTNNSFNQDKAVGNKGENRVQFLINSMPDWKCMDFGVENHIEDLKKTVRKKINEVTKKIKSMPDFVAFNTKNGKTFFIEAKYRKNSTEKGGYVFGYKRLEEYQKYWKGTKLIIVRPKEPYFVYVDLDKIDKKMKKSRRVGPKEWWDYWNFEEIEQDIRGLFPELSEEIIKTASEL